MKVIKMKVITAPENYCLNDNKVSVFLAGGITNCPNWQKDLIKYYKENHPDDDLFMFNPRRENFPINIPEESFNQICWEYKWLERADIFSMYFSSGESDQPICMYELGRNILRMQMRFPNDWYDRIIISVEPGYKRIDDVIVQTELATNSKLNIYLPEKSDNAVYNHADLIHYAYLRIHMNKERVMI